MNARQMIEAERRRQIEVEGWTPQHDDEHSDGEMSSAADFYFLHGTGKPLTFRADGAPLGWRWDACWWKPKTPELDLVRAGALYLAERERLKRLPGSGTLKLYRAAKMDRKIARVVAALTGKTRGDETP